MDAYKTPESNLELPPQRAFKPIKALVFGLLVSVGLLLVVSALEMLVVAVLNREALVALVNENEINAFFAKNITFLSVDLLLSFAVLYFAGTMVKKYAVGYELKFAVILALLTFCVHLLIFSMNDSDDVFPMWYNVAGALSVFAAIIWGAKAKR